MNYINFQSVDDCLATLSETGFVRVPNFLDEHTATTLESTLKELNFNTAATVNARPHEFTASELQNKTNQEKQQLFSHIYEQASQGIGFVYGRRALSNTTNEELIDFKKHLNSSELLERMSRASQQKIIKASAQATCYQKGDFLTRHNDVIHSEGRVYAYVLGLTEQWHPDWGGLLQFYEPDGTPTNSYAPQFNSLTIFDVTKIHSVSYVTPFAKSKRLSITGWFRTK
ncbi:proline hydroxylase [Pseudoalteromonas phenolica]|uniref:Proline hydroxylase n=1 Tax=Pseudoalteromonas phenolica TaxID=161398 RepID=A0A5S3YYN6_9GAMM|nr:2OG-Fe(II) oxygenase family protein [Pseudoalteromonas phenolica]TMP82887.1 proline hydroxylase [Pseudoalteromonas phenolica]